MVDLTTFDHLGFLGPLDVAPDAERFYAQILGSGGIELGDVANNAGLLAQLLKAGLVREDRGEIVAIPVRLAVERWVADQESRIQRARHAAAHYATLERSTSGSFLELIRGLDASREAAAHLVASARRELRVFDREPYFSDSKTVPPYQESMMSHGVRCRTLYQQQALEDPSVMSAVRTAIGMGEQARTFPDVPIRMLVADGSRALLVLPYGSSPTDGEPTDLDSILVHESAFLDALLRLFDSLWPLGVPINELYDPSTADEHRQLLGLLVAGLTDASIARELGVSERTVHRRIYRLQQLLGANTRFLLGVQAVRHGWI